MVYDSPNIQNIYNNLVKFLSAKSCSSIAVGVSGGSDSTFLLLMLHKVGRALGIKVVGLIVNHNIRAESCSEANSVQSYFKDLGITVNVLHVTTNINKSIQENARIERYKLLLEYCTNKNIQYLFIAHNLEDQLETYIMRKSKGDNIVGLSCMHRYRIVDNITLLRPMLTLSNVCIKQYLSNNNYLWVEDPSNTNLHYSRVRVRQELAKLDDSKKTAILSDIYSHQTQRLIIEAQVDYFIHNYISISNYLEIKVPYNKLYLLPNTSQIYLLRYILRVAGGMRYGIAIKKSKDILNILNSNCNIKVTAGRCIIHKKHNYIYIFREYRNIEIYPVSEHSNTYRWDGRFIINYIPQEFKRPGVVLQPLTYSDYCNLLLQDDYRPYLLDMYSKHNIRTLPWIYENGSLIVSSILCTLKQDFFSNYVIKK